jgi:phosphopantetheinyl transferase (holo-ACP synthase)
MNTFILKIIREYIEENRKPKGFWSDEDNLRREASKFKTRTEFQKGNQTAYKNAVLKGDDFFNEITAHMPKPKSMSPYTDEELTNLASKVTTKKEFMNKFPGAYQVAIKRGPEFWNKITSHMEQLGSKHKRLVYAYFFPKNNAVYVGLTYNIKERDFQHLQSEKHLTSVRQFINLTGEMPNLVKLTDLLDVKIAQQKEGEYVNKFYTEGFNVLNKVKTGGLGAGLKYTDDELEKIAKSFDNIKDFYTQNLRAHKMARRRGEDFFKRITSHMTRNQETWTEDKVRTLASRFENKNSFQKVYPGAVAYSKKIGIWDELFPKIEFPTNDEIIRIAQNFNTQNDFRINHPSLYNHAKNIGLLSNIQFKKSKIRSKSLTDEDIILRASNYTNLKDFYTNDNTAYRAAKRIGDEFFQSLGLR